MIHLSPVLFPEPSSFIPERWLTSSALKRHARPPGIPEGDPAFLVPFSRGTRNCIGQTLAMAEIYFTLAVFLRTFARLDGDGMVSGMRLWETDRRDVDLKRDFLAGQPEKGRGNLQVILD